MMIDFLVTSVLFYCTLVLLPVFVLSYLVLNIGQRLWLTVISLVYPELEFLKNATVRTLLDTHRNQGIISVLLAVKGQAHPEAVRRHLSEVARRRDKKGDLVFPRLRHCLVARCGTYAWKKGTFDLDQNLTVAPINYKGRAITEINIQDCVSEISSKYLPQGIPPWQVIIIPSAEDQHYILFKLHHVLLSEGLNIGDLLPLIPPTRQPPGAFSSKSPLVEVLRKPTAIPELKQRLAEELTNTWNEFVSNYDPLECTKLLKSTPGFFEFLAITLVSSISTLKEYKKGFRNIHSNLYAQAKYFAMTLKKECKKRNLSFAQLFASVFVSMDPRNFAVVSFKLTKFLILFPVTCVSYTAKEISAIYSCATMGYCSYRNTLTGVIYNYLPLTYNSLKEIYYYFSILFQAPRNIIQDILLQKETFQTITLCGRKSVAWSDGVKIEQIKRLAIATGVSEIEIMLSAISGCISRYFVQTKHVIPDELPLNVRNINSNYIFATGQNIKPEDACSGILCLNLPIVDPEKDATALENLVEVKKNFRGSLEKQGLSHLLTLLQTKFGLLTKFLPRSMLGVYLRYLSRKYAISVAEVTSRYPNVTQKTLWGQEVVSVIYWRPPQANASVSLCLNEYADQVKLGVMCDSQLVPHHATLAKTFPEFIQDLGRAAGIEIH